MTNLIKAVIVAVTLAFTTLSYANVQVIDGYNAANNAQDGTVVVTDQADGADTASSLATAGANNDHSTLAIKQRVTILERQVNNLTQVLSQVNQLQSQLQDLQGTLEVQKHTIKVLQDQVRSQYQDLDQRIGAIKTTSPKATTKSATVGDEATTKDAISSATQVTNTSADDSAVTVAKTKPAGDNSDKTDDQKAYATAIDLLKAKKYSQATTSFQKFIKQYPTNRHANDARFWLGQLYLLAGEPDRALEQFHIVLKKDPNNKKMPDIILQAGLAYFSKGDMLRAQAAFKKLIQQYPTSSAAKLAQTRLKLIEPASAPQQATDSTDNKTPA